MKIEITEEEKDWLIRWLNYEAKSDFYFDGTLIKINNLLAKLENNG